MRYPVTLAATLIGVAICLYNSTGYDPHNMVFFMLSVPAWIADMIVDIHSVNVYLMYVLTVATWALLGFICDKAIARNRRRSY
ncbi:hypothetical protein GZH47_27120 [Paenibacillus rhizovicinus]|uniref:Uncharacterized protein n=1 Tax=Paenibacillus rhizovicinus TaxID=2704463 RepID=A0A6C0P697_9BACL|nr:hypothetical protein [Paenibacillus rhizovicinus]QHW34104.1 hypothetical protein GZH47_27120 [Paenibacillus rhizovicinus]